MRITEVDARPFTLTRRSAMRTRTMSGAPSRHVLITVRTDEGIEGNAEALAKPSIYGETPTSIVAIVREHIAPMLIGADPWDTQEVLARLFEVPANNSSKAAVDIALHDLLARALDMPLYRLWGGGRTIQSVSWTLGIRDPEDMVAEAERIHAESGIVAFKVKGGVDPSQDVQVIRLLRERLGPEAQLSLDPNEGYTADVAARVLGEMDAFGLAYVEEPIPHAHYQARADLARRIPMPILGDDSCFTIEDVVREIDIGAVGMVSIKTPRTGFHESSRIATVAEAFGLRCVVGTAVGGGLSSLAALQFACSRPSLASASENSFGMNIVEDLVDAPLPLDGHLEVPVGAGLGVTVHAERLASLADDGNA
jgi:L-alanine-DL-glutamate epimerase-like enolase superfamily enzyme